jgi:hypothetical protein
MSSLCAPWDRAADEKYVTKQVVLTEAEVSAAHSELVDKSFTAKFPRVEKFYADPVICRQAYCLHSFVPTKGATPDEHGVYGFVKFRGAFETQQEADERAEFLIRNVDSFHDIYTSYCGRAFPLSANRKFVQETNAVDIRDHAVRAISEDVKAKVQKDKCLKDEMTERQEALLADTEQNLSSEPGERYIELQVKRANLVHVYVETRKSLAQIKDLILKCRGEISAFDSSNPECRTDYVGRYETARANLGLELAKDTTYLQYMGLDDEEILGF